jgi:sortase (surface protein transpeptidase)
VIKSDIYDFNSRLSEIFTSDNQKLIKLITCTGTWMQSFKTHDKRLVVTAVLVEE